MPERGRGLLILVLLAGALASSWWVWWRDRVPAGTGSDTAPRSDYVLHHFTLASFGPDGQLEFRIEAPYLEREPGGDALSVQTPQMLLRDPDGALWQLDAEDAWVRGDGELVRLLGAVRLESPDDARSGPTLVNSRDLDAWPRQQRIEGNTSVEVLQPGARLTSIGMQLDLGERRLQLLSDVRARYVPVRDTETEDAPDS